ncbi:MAG TPA: hypothetical protein PL185_10980 [Flavobacteriales bacterium]|nr:hypothetical protein [Flavobacteriales bacterium]
MFKAKKSMGAIIIKADQKSNKILLELAKRLGANVLNMNDAQYEDFLLGSIMEEVKTGKEVSKEEVIKKLKQK